MPEPLVYELPMTSEFCRAAKSAPFEQVLWMQNERSCRHLESRMPGIDNVVKKHQRAAGRAA